MNITRRDKGINALLSHALPGDVFWIESSKPITGYARTGRRIVQNGFWAINKRTGDVIRMLRVTVV